MKVPGKNSKPDPTKEPKLHVVWRCALAAVGVAFIVYGLIWWSDPPKRDQFAPQAASKDAHESLPAVSETMVGVTIGVGAVLLILAANGRKLTSIKVGDVEAAWAGAAADEAEKKVTTKAEADMTEKQIEDAQQIARAHAFSQTLTLGPFSVDLDAVADAAVEAVRRGATAGRQGGGRPGIEGRNTIA